ncbi:hypothetical protein FN846DRAFT_887579 [Sphaerosporella brunnea]|uniref:Uncharacterized protein n=1 Tax=Sphaerosporella brunnea TaxID=1250544 RepID=A0A5J5F625_9PEZI|nr:hypothetical protein FN846DRAFT_887579 [Sphaerosporella brunnea]
MPPKSRFKEAAGVWPAPTSSSAVSIAGMSWEGGTPIDGPLTMLDIITASLCAGIDPKQLGQLTTHLNRATVMGKHRKGTETKYVAMNAIAPYSSWAAYHRSHPYLDLNGYTEYYVDVSLHELDLRLDPKSYWSQLNAMPLIRLVLQLRPTLKIEFEGNTKLSGFTVQLHNQMCRASVISHIMQYIQAGPTPYPRVVMYSLTSTTGSTIRSEMLEQFMFNWIEQGHVLTVRVE